MEIRIELEGFDTNHRLHLQTFLFWILPIKYECLISNFMFQIK